MLLVLLGVGDGTHDLLSHGHYKLRSKTYHISHEYRISRILSIGIQSLSFHKSVLSLNNALFP